LRCLQGFGGFGNTKYLGFIQLALGNAFPKVRLGSGTNAALFMCSERALCFTP